MTLILPVSFEENISPKIENSKIQHCGAPNYDYIRASNIKLAGGGGPSEIADDIKAASNDEINVRDRFREIRDALKVKHENVSPVKILPDGRIVSDEYRKSYWYCFITSLDREKDVTLLKEIVFWERIYHKNTSQVEVLVPDNDRYYFYSRLFQIYEVPCLVLTDSDTYPLDYVIIPKKIISEEYLGERYIKFRELLDFFHNIVMNDGKLSKVKKEIIKQKVESILEKSSSVLKEIVINIGGRAI